MKPSFRLPGLLALSWLVSLPALAKQPPAGTYTSVPDRLEAGGLHMDVERGLLFVPENRAAAGSRVIGVHFIRIPAAQPDRRRPEPVFVLPGGPGYEFNFSREVVLRLFERLRQTRDVIYVSQRGNPAAGGQISNLRVNVAPAALDVPDSLALERERQRQAIKQTIARWTERGVDLRGYDILNVVDDVHDLRTALGYDKIVLRGCSFGSQWSLAYLKRWPKTVDRMLLSGVEPLDHAYDSPQWLWNSLARLAQRAEADAQFAPHVPRGGLLAAIQAVLGRLEKQSVHVQIQDPASGAQVRMAVGPVEFQQAIADQNVYGDTREEQLGNWPRFMLEMYRGDYRYLAAKVWEARTRQDSGGALSPLIVPLIDNSLGISAARDARLLAEPPARWLGDINSYYRNTRDLVPTPDVGDAFRADGPIRVPVLMLQGDLDWSTPIENARHLAGRLQQGHLVEIEGATHCDEIDVAERQLPQIMDQAYAFVAADFATTPPEQLFAKLPRTVAYRPIRFAPPEGPSLYERWLERARLGRARM